MLCISKIYCYRQYAMTHTIQLFSHNHYFSFAELCNPDCLTCSQSADHCDMCRDETYFLQMGLCVHSCDPGFYLDGQTCLGNALSDGTRQNVSYVYSTLKKDPVNMPKYGLAGWLLRQKAVRFFIVPQYVDIVYIIATIKSNL